MKLIINDTAMSHADDVMGIVSVCTKAGYEISPETARRAWEAHSESMEAGWMGLPNDEDYLLYVILSYTKEEG